MKIYIALALALIAALACTTLYPVHADHEPDKEADMVISPCTREQTVQPGQPIDSVTFNAVQDKICAIANAAEMVPFHGNTAMTAGTLKATSTGAIVSDVVGAFVFEVSPIVPEAKVVQSIAFRVKDNGASGDTWSCNFGVVDADDNVTTDVAIPSIGTGNWEWIIVPVNHLFQRGDRLVMTCGTNNASGAVMLASGATLIYPTA